MPRVTPSQAVKLIDKKFPQVAQAKQVKGDFDIHSSHSEKVKVIVDAINQIPSELITFEGDDLEAFIESRSILEHALKIWLTDGRHRITASPIILLRSVLAKFPDDALTKGAKQIEERDTVSATDKYINVTSPPDDFYAALIDEINRLYANRFVMSLSIMLRKLLENLVIDILRKKYRTSELPLYYDASRKRFHDFSQLLKNLDFKKADFQHITSSLNSSFIGKIHRYREIGNSSAHSIDANLSIDQFSRDKDNLNYLVQLLLRILQNV